ncbi:MAG TPA: glycosyltransferase [Nitrospira sp.]
MTWLNQFYSSSVAIPLSLVVLAAISLLSWKKRGRQLILALTIFLYARYLLWRGLYTLNAGDWTSLGVSLAVYTAEAYAFVQILLFAYHAWSPLERQPVPLHRYPMVDIFVTVVNEPIAILRRTLVGCINQEYPRDRYRVHVLDDGPRAEVQALAASLKCGYITRPDRQHAKAGNLNHALQETSGEIVAIFDVDHVPTSGFLKETVGFFQDRQVAFVQTPHHFYNPDVFQKNLQLEGELKNEQALFYRVLQSGRDRHNSAFFAGSCGLFRRSVLTEIGGFRTETVTEDIHTSMTIHAKGYRSCYLNKVLAAGLMPESFESSMKQRIRWAMGHVQIFFQTNPFTMRGLTFPQRLGYFSSIFYFLHGIPRVICLVAPLFALLLGIVPVTADVPSIINFFGSYYLATLVMLRTVSRGTRNAFWSDIYETAGCFALSWATLKAALRPRKKRPFVITAKGVSQDRRGTAWLPYVLPHLLVMGLLIAGLVTGVRLWLAEVPLPGLEVSLFWGAVNLILVGVAILAAVELPEWRKAFRIRGKLPCELVRGDQRFRGIMEDINEGGALIRAPKQVLEGEGDILGSVNTRAGERLIVRGRLCRHKPVSKMVTEIGLKFIDVDERTTDSLIAATFADSRSWNSPELEPGIFRSLWSVLGAFAKMVKSSRTSHRYDPRLPFRQVCRLELQGRTLLGTMEQVSMHGCSVEFPGTIDQLGEHGAMYVGPFAFQVRRRWMVHRGGIVVAGFAIEQVNRGADQWQELTSPAA